MVEGAALEKRYPAKSGIVGSNPTLSAIMGELFWVVVIARRTGSHVILRLMRT